MRTVQGLLRSLSMGLRPFLLFIVRLVLGSCACASLAVAQQSNNVTIACNGNPVQGKICRDGQNCSDSTLVANYAPFNASASPQDNLNFVGVGAAGADITYALSVPEVGKLLEDQADP